MWRFLRLSCYQFGVEGRVRVSRSGLLFLALAWLGGCAASPNPLTQQELALGAETNLALVTADQEPLNKAVDLYEAMARALKYNLDYRVEAANTSLRAAELNLTHFSLLPNAVASAGYAARDNDLASSSFNLVTNASNFGASTSQDRHVRSGDLSFSWNILDFGLSYVRARQAADKVLIGEEMQRKVTHRLLEDVRTAYWRAVSYDRLITRLKRLEARTRVAIANSRSLANSRQTSLITALTYERELVEINRATRELQRDLIVAKSQLAALMNEQPGTPFKLAASVRSHTPEDMPVGVEQMMETAIRNRVELRENLYQQRINMHEAHAALLELLPGLQLYAGPQWDSNSFLLTSDWVAWGAKASWNLLRVFQYPAKRNVIDAQDDVLKMRALALTMAVMTQVHVSRIRFHHFRREFAVADEYRSVQNRLVQQIRAEAQANRVSEQVALREEMNTLVAEAKYDVAYAHLQSAYANVFASIGWDPYGTVDRSLPVSAIAASLQSDWLERGELGTKVSQADREMSSNGNLWRTSLTR